MDENEWNRLKASLETILGEIDCRINRITHPYGRLAHFLDSQDEIRVEELRAIRDVVTNEARESKS